MESNESSCLHVKDIAFHAKNPNSYEKKKIKGSQFPDESKDWLPVSSILKLFKLQYPFLLLQFLL